MKQDVHTCRWAAPTLFLKWPYWLDAWSWPWTCTREGQLRLLSSTEQCATCSSWDLREPGARPPTVDDNATIVREQACVQEV
jgi:hypothetical protein